MSDLTGEKNAIKESPMWHMNRLAKSEDFAWYLGRIEKRVKELESEVLCNDSLTAKQREARRYARNQFRDLLDNEFKKVEREEVKRRG